jgi:hypothetical protein
MGGRIDLEGRFIRLKETETKTGEQHGILTEPSVAWCGCARGFKDHQPQNHGGVQAVSYDLLVVLQATRRTLGDAPSRSSQALAQRIGVTEAEAAALSVPSAEPSPPVEPPAATPTPVTPSPLSATMGRSDGLRAPRTRLSRRAVIVARKHAIP